MPKDNHSVMQLYLDGLSNNFFTFFFVHEKGSKKIINKNILSSKKFLRDRRLLDLTYAQKKATENVLKKKEYLLEVLRFLKEMKRLLGNYLIFLS